MDNPQENPFPGRSFGYLSVLTPPPTPRLHPSPLPDIYPLQLRLLPLLLYSTVQFTPPIQWDMTMLPSTAYLFEPTAHAHKAVNPPLYDPERAFLNYPVFPALLDEAQEENTLTLTTPGRGVDRPMVVFPLARDGILRVGDILWAVSRAFSGICPAGGQQRKMWIGLSPSKDEKDVWVVRDHETRTVGS